MPWQIAIGAALVVLGFAGQLVALYFKLDAAVVTATMLITLGSGLFAKERFPQSPEAARKYSTRPPPGYFR